MLLVLLQGRFKKAGIQFERSNVLRNEDRKYWTSKVFHPTPEHALKSHLCLCWMTSQAYNNRNELLFPLQIWKHPHGIKRSDCFEHLHEENTKPLVNLSVLHAWIFSLTSGFLWFSQRGGEEWRNSNRMGEGCWCSIDYFLPPYFGREELLNSKLRKQHSRGDIKTNIHDDWNWKYFRSSYVFFGK